MAGLLEALESMRLVLEAISSGEYCCLRHGLPYITVGDLVRQALCEMRLHYEYSRGGVGEARRRELRVLVEAVLEARRRVSEGFSDGVLSTPLAAVVEGVPVVGRPDAILVSRGRVEAIVWAKVSRSTRVKPWDRVRLYSLGLLADYGGLPRSSLKLVLVVAPEPAGLIEPLKLLRNRVEPGQGDGYSVHVLAYDREVALNYVGPLLAYWKGLRDPVARRSRACMDCPFRSICGLGEEFDTNPRV